MPGKLYCCRLQKTITQQEQDDYKKQDVLIRNKIKYWKKHYPFIVERDDYEDFVKISKHALEIYKILDFLRLHKKGKLPSTQEELLFYCNNYKIIQFSEDHLFYIKTLKLKE